MEQQKSAQSDDKLMQTQELTLRRFATYQREFDLLQFSLSSARIFFRAESSLDNQASQEASSINLSASASAMLSNAENKV